MRTLIILVLISVLIISCENNPTQSEADNGSISISSYLSQSAIVSSTFPKGSGSNAIDSIEITRARFLIRYIKFKTVNEDSMEFKSAPTVIDLNLDGLVNNIDVSEVPFDVYNRVEFKVHRLDPDDPQDKPYVNETQFADFMTLERLSIIIEGIVYETGSNEKHFVFESRINEKQRHFLIPELVVTEENPSVNVTMFVNSVNWFTDSNSNLLDPTDQSNEKEIEDNLKDSIEFIKDNNKDGIEDNS